MALEGLGAEAYDVFYSFRADVLQGEAWRHFARRIRRCASATPRDVAQLGTQAERMAVEPER